MGKKDLNRVAKALLDKIKTPEQAQSLSPKLYQEYLKALDQVQGPQAKRVAKMQYDIKRPLYHGSPVTKEELTAFQPSGAHEELGSGVYLTDKRTARSFGENIHEVVQRGKTVDFGSPEFYDALKKGGMEESAINELIENGYINKNNMHGADKRQVELFEEAQSALDKSGVTGIAGDFGDSFQVNVPNPSNLRRPEAAFDTRFADSPNLLAGIGAVPAAAAAQGINNAIRAQKGYISVVDPAHPINRGNWSMSDYANYIMGAGAPGDAPMTDEQQADQAMELAMSMGPGAIAKAGAKFGRVLMRPTAQEAAESRMMQMLDKRPQVKATKQELVEDMQNIKMKKPQGMAMGGMVEDEQQPFNMMPSGMPMVSGPMGIANNPQSEVVVPQGIQDMISNVVPNYAPIEPQGLSNEAPASMPQMPMGGQQQAGAPDLMTQLGNVQSQGYAQQAQAYQNAMNEMQQRQMEHQQRLQELTAERDAFIQDIKDAEIDPNRYFNRMGTGQRITSAIGLMLGGLGAGLQGGKANPVQSFIEQQLNNDLKAQQLELGKKENLLSANLKQFGNMNDAMRMTQAMQNDYLKHQVDMAAAKSNSQQAKINAEILKQQLDQKNALLMDEIAMSMGRAPQGDPDQAFMQRQMRLRAGGDDKTAGDERERYVPGMGIALSKEGAKAVREMSATVKSAESGIQELLKIADMGGASLNPKLRDRADTIRQTMIGALRLPITGPGAMNEGERKLLENIIKDPTAIFSLSAVNKSGLQALAGRLQNLLAEKASAEGINLGQRRQQGQQQQFNFKPSR